MRKGDTALRSDAESAELPEKVSFIVPTLMRPEFLRRCLNSIANQTISPTQVLVGIRRDDEVSASVVKEFEDRLPIFGIEAKGVGVVGSMNSCFTASTGKLIALLDDDVELPPRWLETMLGHLAANADVLGAGGRDFLQDHPEMRRSERRVENVGRISWYGRVTGNHHRGAGMPRRVDILRGSNCLFRGAFLREAGFEQRLKGKGAQVNWELALAFQATARHGGFFYDPTIEVLHHAAPRFDNDSVHRGGYEREAVSDIAFNETFVTWRHGTGFHRIAVIVYQFLVGSPACPGLAHLLKHAYRRSPNLKERFLATLGGRIEAFKEMR